MQRLLVYIKKYYALDIRALSFMRIAIALVILYDLFVRVQSLEAHYTMYGVLPADVQQINWNPWMWSIHTWFDTRMWEMFVFGVHFIFAGLLLVGYRTSLSTVACWILAISLQNRNTFIMQGGDDLLRLTLFWGMFLPWGKFFSVDSQYYILGAKTKKFSLAGIGFFLMVCSVFFFTGIHKNSDEWLKNGNALYYALNLDSICKPLGHWLVKHYELCKFLTYFALGLEFIAPLLIIFPIHRKLKIVGVIAIAVLMIGISLCLSVGIFWMVVLANLLAFLPSVWMNKIEPYVNKLLLLHRLVKEKYVPNYRIMRRVVHINSIKNAALGLVLFYCLIWNWCDSPWSVYELDGTSKNIAYPMRLDQHWAMFAPSVFKDDGWFVTHGQKSNGQIIDVMNNGQLPTVEKPINVLATYKDDRWRKYSENFLMMQNDWLRPYYCKYLLNNWNKNNEKQSIGSLKIYYLKEFTLDHYKTEKAYPVMMCECEKDWVNYTF